MKRLRLFILLIFIFAGMLSAGMVTELEEVVNPELMEIVGDRVLIVQGAEVFVYDLQSFDFIKKFGRQGEGPGELKVIPAMANFIVPVQDKFIMASIDKAILFDLAGNVQKEMKIPQFTNYLYPAGDGYIGMKFKPGDKGIAWFELSVLDMEFKTLKVFFRQKMSGGQNRVDLTFDGMGISVMDNKIIVDNSPAGFSILIFDMKGNPVKEIKKDYKVIPFTPDMKRGRMEKLKEHPSVRQIGWENFKKIVRIEHGEFMPLIQDLVTDSGKIYVMTNAVKEGNVEFLEMDMAGKVLGRRFLPEPNEMDFGNRIFGRSARFYKIYRGDYYYLRENADEEIWELHKSVLK